MIIVTSNFFDVCIKERRFIFFARPIDQHSPMVITQEAESDIDQNTEMRLSGLAFNALQDFLSTNPKIAEFFKSSENSLEEKAFQSIYERLSQFLNDKKKLGQKVSEDYERDIANLMCETVCKVICVENKLFQTESKLSSVESELEHQKKLNDTDPLTLLPNRRAFEKRLKEEIARSSRTGPLCLIIFDVDKFKRVNDKYGHLAGDQVLREIADCFRAEEGKKILRATDIIARNGGDELYILLSKTDIEGACDAARRISEMIRRKRFYVGKNGNSKEIQLTVSIGISEYEGAVDDPDGSKMMDQADDCLYIMKGEKEDINGVKKERRGQIACNKRVITDYEIAQRESENSDETVSVVKVVVADREKILSI